MRNLLIILSLCFSIHLVQANDDCNGECGSDLLIEKPELDISNISNVLIATSNSNNQDRFPGIHGPDDRQIISNPRTDPRTIIYRVGLLEITLRDGTTSKCTATLVGKKILLTAAHCFYNQHVGKFEGANAYFYLQASKDSRPVSGHRVTRVFLPQKLKNDEDRLKLSIPEELINKDYALLELSEELGQKISPVKEQREGWNTVGSYPNLEKHVEIKTAGYPADKNGHLTFERCMADSYSKGVYEINCDLYPGQSGSSIIARVAKKNKNGENKIVSRVIGVVSAAGYTNFAVRIDDHNSILLRDWYMHITKGNSIENPNNTHIMNLGY